MKGMRYLAKNNVRAQIWKKYLACWLGGRIPLTLPFRGSFHPTNSPDISFRSLHSHVLGLIGSGAPKYEISILLTVCRITTVNRCPNFWVTNKFLGTYLNMHLRYHLFNHIRLTLCMFIRQTNTCWSFLV